MPFDLLFYVKHLRHAATLARRFPALPMVIDHLAKPRIKDRHTADWLPHLLAAAAFPNVYCKLSTILKPTGVTGARTISNLMCRQRYICLDRSAACLAPIGRCANWRAVMRRCIRRSSRRWARSAPRSISKSSAAPRRGSTALTLDDPTRGSPMRHPLTKSSIGHITSPTLGMWSVFSAVSSALLECQGCHG